MSKGIVTTVLDFVAENATTLLTVAVVGGVIATAVTSWYAAKKTEEVKEEIKEETGEEIDNAEVIKRSWKYYIAPVVLGTLTIVSVIVLNIEHDKKYAAILGAYTLAKADKEKLGEKVKELVGEERAKEIKDNLGIKDEDAKLVTANMVIPGDPYKKEWIMDGETGMRIYTSKVAVVNAANMVNQMIAEDVDGGQTVEDLYNYIGVPDDNMPNIAQSMSFKIGERIGSLKIEWGGITDNDLNTIPVFNYDYNLDRDVDWGHNRYCNKF